MKLNTEPANDAFLAQGARLCVVIPDPEHTTLDDVIRAGHGAIIINEDEAGEHSFVVRIGATPQEELQPDFLRMRFANARSQEDTPTTKYVLLVEDDQKYSDQWRLDLEEHGYSVVWAVDIERALEVFPQRQWNAIVVDGCIGGDDFNSPPLIRQFKTQSRPGLPIIAATKNPDLATLMLEAGCTHAARKKDHVPGMLHSILRQQ